MIMFYILYAVAAAVSVALVIEVIGAYYNARNK